jgi:hypothetical protein
MNLAEKFFGLIPNGLLTIPFKLIAQKLIGNIPEEKKKAAWDAFLVFWKITVEAGSAGAARGMTNGMKDRQV